MTLFEAPVELIALFGATLVVFASIVAQAVVMDLRSGVPYALSGRAEPPPRAAPIDGRLGRNVRNQIEGLAMFAPLVLIATSLELSNDLTRTASVAFVAARALFALAYGLDLVPWRSIAWITGLIATIAFGVGLI